MPFSSMAAFKAFNREQGYHFFDRETLRFFRSNVGSTLYGGRYFVTSEQFDSSSPRLYSVREALDDGKVATPGGFQNLRTKADAVDAIKRLLKKQPNPLRRNWQSALARRLPNGKIQLKLKGGRR